MNSNTTLVKVKLASNSVANFTQTNSNTTLVKVKFSTQVAILRRRPFKYNSC